VANLRRRPANRRLPEHVGRRPVRIQDFHVDALVLLDPVQVEVYGAGLGDVFRTWVCRIDSMSLGPFAVREPIAAMSLSRHGMIGSDDYAGNIGNSVLERFRCTFDYPRRTLYLEPGRRFAERDRVSRFGALFALVGRTVVAGEILMGSAADEAGLH
jgi:hypothetical protein